MLIDNRHGSFFRKCTPLGLGALALILVTYRAARATGIPSSGALTYSGIVTDAAGNPLGSPQSVGVAVYNAASGGKKVCEQAAQDTEVDATGHFQVGLPDACATAVGAQPDLWVEVSVAGSSLGRVKIGAVPYAIAAGDAATVQGKSPDDLAAPTGMIGMFAAACPSGWSLCDGTSGTPDLVDSYVKAGTKFAASTGTNTHSHTLTGTTSSDGKHRHFGAFTWDVGTSTPSGAESLYESFQPLDSTVVDDSVVKSGKWGSSGRLDIPGATGHADATYSLGSGMPTTTVGDHSHSVTGTTDEQNHEPVHATLVFCMKN